jgi:hypothetical protein
VVSYAYICNSAFLNDSFAKVVLFSIAIVNLFCCSTYGFVIFTFAFAVIIFVYILVSGATHSEPFVRGSTNASVMVEILMYTFSGPIRAST